MTINIKADISNAEFEVLDVLWDDYPATSSNLVERLSERKDWHHKTVKTLLSRLVKKQIVSYEQDGRQYRYFPLIAREEYTQKEKWLGAQKIAGKETTTFEAMKKILEKEFIFVDRTDVPFVIRETKRKYQHTVAEMTAWKRK